MPARILDDLVVCRTRAYYTLHSDQMRQRRLPDMEESKRRGINFVKEFLKPALERLLLSGKAEVGEEKAKLLCGVKVEEGVTVGFENIDRPIVCVPDATALLRMKNGVLRCLVFEVSDVDAQQIMRSKHVLYRVLLYTLAVYYRYGIPSAGVYISLSPWSDPPALLVKLVSTKPLENKLQKVRELLNLPDAPKPQSCKYCYHCVYRHACRYSG